MAETKVSINTQEIISQLRSISTQVNAGLVSVLNSASDELRLRWANDLDNFIKKAVPFTKRIFSASNSYAGKANESKLQSMTFFGDIQAEYLHFMTEGDTREPGDYATLSQDILTPIDARLTAAGNFPEGPKRWIAKLEENLPGAFVGVVKNSFTDKKAVWQKSETTGKLKLLAVFDKLQPFRKILPLEKTADEYGGEFKDMIDQTLAAIR